MNFKKLAKFMVLPLALIMSMSVVACGGGGGGGGGTGGSASGITVNYDLPDAPSGAIGKSNGNTALKSGEYALEFYKPSGSDLYGIKLTSGTDELFYNDKPCQVFFKEKTNESNYSAHEYFVGYTTVTKTDFGYLCEGKIGGQYYENKQTILWVLDAYSISTSGVLDVNRQVHVKQVGDYASQGAAPEVGFRSRFLMYSSTGSQNLDDYSMFVPSLIYKDDVKSQAGFFGGMVSSTVEAAVQETRMGLPMAMLRQEDTGYALAISHKDIEISYPEYQGGILGETKISNEYKFGSVGYVIKGGAGVEFNWPSYECPKTATNVITGTTGYWHEFIKGDISEYSMSLIPSFTDTYNDAMVQSYTKAYELANVPVADTDTIKIDQVYQQNAEFVNTKHQNYGMAFNYNLSDGNVKNLGNIQMGFIGMATQLGNQLMDYGYKYGNSSMVNNGYKIVNNWVNGGYSAGLPAADRGASSGSAGSYPVFIRSLADGMDGILDAYLIAKKNGANYSAWYNYLVGVTNKIVSIQNSNGSFNRCYETNGSVCTRVSSSVPDQYQGASLFNTPAIVRFLSRMYELTGTASYKTAALNAAKWAYNNMYTTYAKYIGGACDNPDVVDKEASAYALYCFTAAYQLETDATWKAKYFEAAEHAACSLMSWVYSFDFPCYATGTNVAYNSMEDGGVIGFSFIATGQQGADNFAAIGYYEMFKVYVMTGNVAYLDMAYSLQQNTKLCTNYDGRMGWGGWRSLCPEATTVSEFQFDTVDNATGGAWLPWTGACVMDPIAKTRHAFGAQNLYDLEDVSLTTLQSRLNTAKNMGANYPFA